MSFVVVDSNRRSLFLAPTFLVTSAEEKGYWFVALSSARDDFKEEFIMKRVDENDFVLMTKDHEAFDYEDLKGVRTYKVRNWEIKMKLSEGKRMFE